MLAKRHLDQHIKLSMLRSVDAIETHRSLLKAAVALSISQPALTRSLQELEDQLQLSLFERHPRGVRPTEAGMAVVGAARRILAELRRLNDELREVGRAGNDSVSIGALPASAAGILPSVLSRLKAQKPELRVRIQQGRTEELLPLLASREIDMVVGRLYEPAAPDGFWREALWTEPLSFLARAEHPLLGDGPVSLDGLRRFELVLPTLTQRVGQEVDGLLARLGLTASVSLRSMSYCFIREILHGTDAISVMPRLMMTGDLMRGTLRVLPVPFAAPERPAGLILLAGTVLPPAGEAVVSGLRAYVAELAERGLTSPLPPPARTG